ncbi:MAG: transglutaminase family protein [Acidobacteria bacterium]|nr:transglutaminase family protein [Acidobacteriota bacterium]MBI3422078.1 transglutaminase family protein [Acidobacteriota bacterium]
MKTTEARAQFALQVARNEDELELDRAALLLAAEEYPQLELEPYLAQLDDFAARARSNDDTHASPITRLLRLNDVLFDELGFRGNTENYFDARNSFLSDVLERRSGIPITLSVVYMEVARRLGLRVLGVGMPGHFLVKYQAEDDEILLDPFHGGRLLSEADCFQMVLQMYQGSVVFERSFLTAVSKKQILTRMLQNLKGIYARAADHHKTLGVIERALLITPDALNEVRDRGLIYAALERLTPALADLETYLRRAPDAKDAAKIKEKIAGLKQRRAQLN